MNYFRKPPSNFTLNLKLLHPKKQENMNQQIPSHVDHGLGSICPDCQESRSKSLEEVKRLADVDGCLYELPMDSKLATASWVPQDQN